MNIPQSHKKIPKERHIISDIKSECMGKLIKYYSTSQDYLYKKIIDDVVQKKQGDKNYITYSDMKFDDGKEHLEKYYGREESCHEIPELMEYYKYYTQDSICFNNKEFAFLAVYHEKKKAILYRQLKKQLNISDSQQSIGDMTRVKSSQKFDNVLSGLDMTRNDQSYLLNQVLKKLVNHYGPSRVKTLNKIDCEFKFMTHNLNINKSKNTGLKQGPSASNPQTVLQSTSTSVRNTCFLKQKSSTKNMAHRRFGSCEVLKSAVVRSTFINNPYHKEKEKQNKEKQKKSRLRRRKSTEAITHFDSNCGISIMEEYKKVSLKTQQPLQNKDYKICFSQNNFRSKMQELRKKIRREKENLNKKHRTTCPSKKKLKKI